MFKSLNRGIVTPIAIIVIVLCAALVGGIVIWQYLEMSKEGKKILEIKPIEEPTTAFLAGSSNDSVMAILYNRIENKITHEKIINFNGLRLGASGFEASGRNDSVQYNTATNQIILFVNNFSGYSGDSLTDAPYSQAIWATSFDKDDKSQIIFIPEGRIRSWITHPDKPIIYVLDWVHSTSPKAEKAEILEINLLSKNVRKIASVSSDLIQGEYFKFVMSKDGNSIFQAVQMHKPGTIFQGAQSYKKDKTLLKQINLVSGEVTIMDMKDESGYLNTNNLSPDEKTFVFFGGWLGKSGLRIHHLKEQKTATLPLPEGLHITNFNLLWSGDSSKLMFLVEYVPFIYSISDKNEEKINVPVDQFPLIWSPAINYIFFKVLKEGNLRWNIFDLKTYKVENIYSSSLFNTTVGVRWVK